MLRHIASFALLATLAGSSSGCAYFKMTPQLASEPKDVWVSQDMPVPEGFKLDRSASWKHERNHFRQLRLVYRRTEYLSEERTREFFKEVYPSSGWDLTFLWGLEDTNMIFTKGAEECLVKIREDFGDRFTEIAIQVRPRRTPKGGFVGRKRWSSGPVPASAKRGETK